MNNTLPIQFDIVKGWENRDEGMNLAEGKANKENPGWTEAALEFLRCYAEINPVFMAEDLRYASQGIPALKVENQKSWGPILVKASKLGYIESNGFQKVKNVKCHATPATRWKSRICKR